MLRLRKLLGRILLVVGILFALGVLAIAGGLTWLHSQVPAEVTLPAPTGPYSVGRLAFDWTDHARTDPFAPAPGTPREITGWIWYPAAPSVAPPIDYIAPPVLDALHKRANPLVASVAGIISVDQADVHSHALDQPPPAPQPMMFPVILMKPGYGGLVHQYSTLAEDLASHGYVVVASDSPYTTPVVVYEDGRVANQTREGHPPENTPGRHSDLAPGWPNDLMLPAAQVWTGDLSFMLDRLHEINAAESEMFAGRLDIASVGAFGHSFGGSASLQFCKDDPRCTAVVNVDGGIWGDVALGGLTKPALFLMSDRPVYRVPPATLDENARKLVEAIDRIRAGLPNHPTRLIVQGSSHYNFADAALLNEPHAARAVGMIGPIDPVRALDVARRYLRAFFDTYLKQQPDKLLDGPSPNYPEAVLE